MATPGCSDSAFISNSAGQRIDITNPADVVGQCGSRGSGDNSDRRWHDDGTLCGSRGLASLDSSTQGSDGEERDLIGSCNRVSCTAAGCESSSQDSGGGSGGGDDDDGSSDTDQEDGDGEPDWKVLMFWWAVLLRATLVSTVAFLGLAYYINNTLSNWPPDAWSTANTQLTGVKATVTLPLQLLAALFGFAVLHAILPVAWADELLQVIGYVCMGVCALLAFLGGSGSLWVLWAAAVMAATLYAVGPDHCWWWWCAAGLCFWILMVTTACFGV